MHSGLRRRGSLKWVGLLGALTCSVALGGCGAVEGTAPAEAGLGSREDGLSSVRVRLLAGNITSGNGQDYDEGHGLRIFQGTHPDVVMIQEFNYGNNTPSALRQFVDTAFGPDFFYYRETGAQIPNGVISRWPILAAGEWTDPYVSNRDFAWARIDVPGPKDLWAVSLHLLTSSSSVRNSESAQLVQYIQQNVPAGDYLAIGGDFNTGSRGELSFSTLSQVVSTSGPYPVDQNGNSNTNATRSKPYDHVLVDGDLLAHQTATVLGGTSHPSGLVVDTRVYSPIANLAPALSTDSAASNMQHMAVIKDFLIPVPSQAASLQVGSPNGGESWAAGSTQSITWSASNVTNVTLEYTLDGSTWNVLASGVPAASGSYAWTVPVAVTSAAKVRVSDAVDASVTDESDAPFTITRSVQVLSPNGGESWAAGSNQVITWSASGVAHVTLEYTLDGSTWNVLASGRPAASGGYFWTVPDVASSTVKVRVSDTLDASLADESDGAFSLTRSVQVLAPNGGESFVAGSNQVITWSASGVTNVTLEYTLDGSTWNVLASSVPAASGGYAWTVPAVATSAAKVRVSAAQDASVTDESDGTFALITGTPRVFLNEVLANEPGSNVAGEFIELVNTGTAVADLSGWTLSDAVTVRHTFASGTLLAPGAVLVVYGAASGIPAGLSTAVGASTGRLDLSNSGDTVTLRDGLAGTVDSASYTSALSGTDGVSMNRSPDVSPSGAFVLHTTLATLPYSPGTRVNGSAFP
jgi:endonuclease/exonuclease/phosphatase family metal-dependent hydrolase